MDYQEHNLSDNNFEQCIKCTICTVYCPVTAVNPAYPGPKQAGPDGERYRLKRPDFYNTALKYCLNCKRCEVACPSNVKIGDIIQSARIKYDRRSPGLRDRMLASTDFVGTVATRMSGIVNGTLSLGAVKYVMDKTLSIDRHRSMPRYSSQKFTTWYRRNAATDQSKYKRQVAYFHGCYANYNYPKLGQDLVKLMNAVGVGVRLMDGERCCGVAKIANRLISQAKRDAGINLSEIRREVADGREVIATSSTCTFTMRDEYPHVLGFDNSDVRDSINMATRYLFRLVDEGAVKLVFREDFNLKVAYHTPCHMEKLGWGIYSVMLLRMIPGLTLSVLDSNCCGIAGTYGFKKENYAYSQAIGSRLFDTIREAGPEVVATDCETCKWQIEMSTGYRVENPVSILADAIDVEQTRRVNGL